MVRMKSVVPGIEDAPRIPVGDGSGRVQVVLNNVPLVQVQVVPGTLIYLGGITTPQKPIVVKGSSGYCSLDSIVRQTLAANLEFFTEEAVLLGKLTCTFGGTMPDVIAVEDRVCA